MRDVQDVRPTDPALASSFRDYRMSENGMKKDVTKKEGMNGVSLCLTFFLIK